MSLYPLDARPDHSSSLDISSGRYGEIDLRTELMKTIFGFGSEISKGIPILIRRLRRDSTTLARIKCECVDELTMEPDLDVLCPFCLGEGFKWDEEWHKCYKTVSGSEGSLSRRIEYKGAGKILDETYKFYFPYDANLIQGDRIVEVMLDVEGQIIEPAKRITVWNPNTIENKRLDNGRTEYYIVSCQNSNAIYIDKDTLSYVENP